MENMERGRNIFDVLAAARTTVFEVTLGLVALAVFAKFFFYESSPLVKSLLDYTSALSRLK